MYTKKEILSQLEKMNAPQDSVVLMHSSLRAVGAMEGGANALLDADLAKGERASGNAGASDATAVDAAAQ